MKCHAIALRVSKHKPASNEENKIQYAIISLLPPKLISEKQDQQRGETAQTGARRRIAVAILSAAVCMAAVLLLVESQNGSGSRHSALQPTELVVMLCTSSLFHHNYFNCC